MLTGEKKYFEEAEVAKINVPRFKELRLKNILEKTQSSATLKTYLPDKTSNRYCINQDFVLRLIAKLEPDYFEALTSSSFAARHQNPELEGKKTTISLKKEVYEKLMSQPFTSSKSPYKHL